MASDTLPVTILLLTLISVAVALKPVILVPGDGGSQLEEKLYERRVPNIFCKKSTADFIHAWWSVKDVSPFTDHCLAVNMILRDVSHRHDGTRFANATGVEMRPFKFGSTIGVEYLDTNVADTWYFAPLVDHLIAKHGYVRDESLFGAPYDWRLAPLDNRFWMHQMQALIERASAKNGGERAVVVAHSLGNLYAWRFLRQMSEQWRRKYIDNYVALSGPWGGASKAFKAVITGDNLHQPLIHPTIYREPIRTWPSVYALFPNAAAFTNDTVFVTVQRRDGGEDKYTLNNLDRLFNAMGYAHAVPIYKHALANLKGPTIIDPRQDIAKTPPGVATHCLYSVGVKTGRAYRYSSDEFPDHFPQEEDGDGDGTVNTESLSICRRWTAAANDGLPIVVQRFHGVSHKEIVKNEDVFALLDHLLAE